MALINYDKNTWYGKALGYVDKINPFSWLRKGVDSIFGTDTYHQASLFAPKEEVSAIPGVDLDNISSSDLLDLAGDSATSSALGSVASSIPVFGNAISSLLKGKSNLNDKQLSLLTSLMEMQNNNEQAQINRDFQREERLEVQDYNTDMWNMSNEYNSLEQQLSRARAAGVSPNAIVGGSSNSGFATPMSSSPQSGATASYSSGLASSILTSGAVVENLLAQAKKTDTESKLNEQQYDFFKLTTEERVKLFDIAVTKGNYENSNLYKDLELKDVSIEIQRGTYNMLCQLNEQELKLKKAQTIDLYNSQYERIQRILLAEEEIKNAKKKGQLLDSEIVRSEDEHLGRILDNRGKLTENDILAIEKESKELELSFCKSMGVPMGTPESMFMYYLWKHGKMWDWNAYIKANSFNVAPTIESLHKMIDDIGFGDDSGTYNKKYRPSYTGTWRGNRGYYPRFPKSLPSLGVPKSLPLPGFGKTIYL